MAPNQKSPIKTQVVTPLPILARFVQQRTRQKNSLPVIESRRKERYPMYPMEHQGLKNKDLVPSVFETESVASAVLKGTRGLTLRHVKRLAGRFKLAADVFITEATR